MTTRAPAVPSNLAPLTLADAALAACTFAASLALYTRSLAPDLLLGDSAEFQTLAYTLGMTHPTGYPVYVLSARLFTLLPLGGLAYRVNLFSAVMASAALAQIYLAGRLLSGWRLAALAGPLALAVAPIFWMHAIIAELYAPAAACLAGVILLCLLWRQSRAWPFLAGAGLLGGLSLGVHSTVALAAPAVLVYLLVSAVPTRVAAHRAWLAGLGGGLLGAGLALLAFVALDSAGAPSSYYHATARHALSVWGLSPAEFDSPLERLNFLYGARQFRAFMFAGPEAGSWQSAWVYGVQANEGFGTVALGLMGLGGLALAVRAWREALFLGLAWVLQFAFVTHYAVFDIQVFYIPGFAILAVFVCAGAGLVMDALRWLAARLLAPQGWARYAAPAAGLGLVTGLAWAPAPLLLESWHGGPASVVSLTGFSDYPFPVHAPTYPRQEAEAVVQAVEDDAIVFTGWDMLYAYYFVAHVEQGRTNMAFHELYPQAGVSRLAESTEAYIRANFGLRPLYFTERPAELATAYRFVRAGPGLFRLEPK